ncbi:hypothetical protein D6789_00170, partial [Candidatus Woesearchaeota archaeon]
MNRLNNPYYRLLFFLLLVLLAVLPTLAVAALASSHAAGVLPRSDSFSSGSFNSSSSSSDSSSIAGSNPSGNDSSGSIFGNNSFVNLTSWGDANNTNDSRANESRQRGSQQQGLSQELSERITLPTPVRGPIVFGEPVQWTTPYGVYTTPPIEMSRVLSTTETTWTKDLFFLTSYNGTYVNITFTEPLPSPFNITLSQQWPATITPTSITLTIPELHHAAMIRLTGSMVGTLLRSYLDLPALETEPLLYYEENGERVYLNNDTAANVTFEQDASGRYTRVYWTQPVPAHGNYGYEERLPPQEPLRSYLPLPNLREPPLFYRDDGTTRQLINDDPRFAVEFHKNSEGLYDRVTWIHDGANVTYTLETRSGRSTPRVRQLPARLGKPVRWRHVIRDGERVLLPRGARVAEVKHERTGEDETQLSQRRLDNASDELILPYPDNYTIIYETPPPTVEEDFPRQGVKRITVASALHYENISANTTIPETPRGAARLYWLVNGQRKQLAATFRDTNGNGRVDLVEWTIPHLSNQTFEIDLTVLTLQSYPTVGGFWTVDFETVGQANLTIEPWNHTTWADLEFNELRCGDTVVTRRLTDGAVRVPDYECNTTSHHVVRVLTAGKHEQRITFGNESQIARNLAGRAPAIVILRGAEGDANQTTDQPIYWNTEDRVDLNAFAHTSAQNNSVEVQQDGVYRVTYGVEVNTATTNSRWQGLVHAYVDGTDTNACYSSGYSRGSNANNKLVASGECLLSLTAGQNVSLVIRRVSNVATQFPAIQRSTSWFGIQLVETPQVIMLREAGGGDTYDTTNITISYDTSVRNDSIFNTSTALGEVTVNRSGLYRVDYGVGVNHNSNNRAAASAHLQVKPSGGSFADTPYGWSHRNQRGSNLAREAALSASTILNLTKGDTVRLRVERASVADPGTLSIVGNRIHFDMEYLGPDTLADTLRAYDLVGKDAITATAFNQTWDTLESEGDDFSYTPGASWFTVARTGAYHIGYAVYANRTFTTTGTRVSFVTRLLVNDVEQNACRGYGYNRGDGGSNIYDSKESAAQAACILELNAGDSVGLQVQRSSSSGNTIWTTGRRVWLTAQSLDYGSTPPSVTKAEINDSTPIVVLSNVTVNASITDFDSGMDTVLIEITYPNGSRQNVTTLVLGTQYYNNSIELRQLGNYTFRFLANDTAGYTNTSEYALTTNLTTQLEVHDNITPTLGARWINESSSVPLNSIICLNVTSVTDNYALNETWAEYTNTNGLKINQTMSSATICNGTAKPNTYGLLVNVGSATGTFYYHAAYANDSSGNIGSSVGDLTLTVTFAPDTVPPEIIINSPENSTYGNGNIAYDITVNERLNDSVVSIDGAPNMTMVNDTLFHWFNASGDHPALSEGVHTARFTVNDSAPNYAKKEVNFTVDLSPPVISSVSVNQTQVTLGDTFRMSAQITETLSTVTSVTYTLNYPGSSANYTPTETSPDTYTYDFTTVRRGHHNWSDIYAVNINGTNHRLQELNVSVYATTTIDQVLTNSSTYQPRNDTITLLAHLQNSSSKDLANQRLSFYVGGALVGTNLTNATGWARLIWNITINQLPGQYVINVTYAQNDTDYHRASYNDQSTIDIYARTVINETSFNDTFPVQ